MLKSYASCVGHYGNNDQLNLWESIEGVKATI